VSDRRPEQMPKALTFYEAWAQLFVALARLGEAVFDFWPSLSTVLGTKALEHFDYAVSLRAEVVGWQQAVEDYRGKGAA
jgi:hypothetical protein